FYVTSDEAEFVYKCTDYYSPQSELTILWYDEQLGIKWPLSKDTVVVSNKDANGIEISECIKKDFEL
ncbi:dTDP-4-keto-6-deoxy-D-glucose epimerase, partial [Vibrio kanaloae]